MEFTDEWGEIVQQPPFIRTPFNYNTNQASDETALRCEDETRAQQQFKEECDINTIIERFGLSGELPNNLRVPIDAEFLDIIDYQTALNQLREADNAFMQLPANIRSQFDNDAGRFVAYCSDDANKEQLKKWGLTRPETPPAAPIEVRVIPDPSAPTKTA